MINKKIREKLLHLTKISKIGLMKVVKDEIQKMREDDLSHHTMIDYEAWYKDFNRFMYGYKHKNIGLNDSTFGKDYINHLLSRGLSNSTIRKHWKNFMKIINSSGLVHDFNTKVLFRNLKTVRKEDVDFFLEERHVKDLISYQTDDINIRRIVDRFLISCLTGCRKSEISSVRVCGEEGNEYLVYTMAKTKKDNAIPYINMIKPIIERGYYKEDLTAYGETNVNRVLKDVAGTFNWRGKVNKYLMYGKKRKKRTLEKSQAISFHDGRRFYGKMLLDRGMSIYKVSKLMGHANVEMTIKCYGFLNKNKMMDEAKDLLNNF